MMRRLQYILILTLLLLLSGCAESAVTGSSVTVIKDCVDKDSNGICDPPGPRENKDSAERIAEVSAGLNITARVVKGKNLTLDQQTKVQDEHKTPDNANDGYALEQLQKDVDEIMNNSFLWREDKDYPGYYKSNIPKFYVIKVVGEKIGDADEFYSQFSAPNWEGYQVYLNATLLEWLHQPLTWENFSSDKGFFEYNRDRERVEKTEEENVFEVEHGKVLEYQLLHWAFDTYGYFDGVWEDTLLVYKVYCSPSFVVLLRPEWKTITIGFRGVTMQTVHDNWERIVKEELRPDFLEKADKILERCPVQKQFFASMSNNPFYSSEELSYEEKTFLRYWDLDINATIETEPDDEEVGIKRVNLTFTNNANITLPGELDIRIEAIIDGKNRKIFVDDKVVALEIRSKESIRKRYQTGNWIYYSDTITLETKMYRWWDTKALIRPTRFTFDRNGTLLKKEIMTDV